MSRYSITPLQYLLPDLANTFATEYWGEIPLRQGALSGTQSEGGDNPEEQECEQQECEQRLDPATGTLSASFCPVM